MCCSKLDIVFQACALTADEQQIVSNGFEQHSTKQKAPSFNKQNLKWLAYSENRVLIGALTADYLWDWLYIDELWVAEQCRGTGTGQKLMHEAETYAFSQGYAGIWLWTQSWQAAGFYTKLGYHEFTRFPDFPRGHARIGFRKLLNL